MSHSCLTAPIICSHFPHGNEHVITCVARLFFASWIAPDLIHDPKNSLLSPASVKFGQCCGCWGLPVFSLLELKHTFPPPTLAVQSHLTPVHATCRIRATPLSVVRKELFDAVACSSVQHFLPLEFSSPLEHCFPDGFRPRGHSLHVFVLPCVHHSGCSGGP